MGYIFKSFHRKMINYVIPLVEFYIFKSIYSGYVPRGET